MTGDEKLQTATDQIATVLASDTRLPMTLATSSARPERLTDPLEVGRRPDPHGRPLHARLERTGQVALLQRFAER